MSHRCSCLREVSTDQVQEERIGVAQRRWIPKGSYFLLAAVTLTPETLQPTVPTSAWLHQSFRHFPLFSGKQLGDKKVHYVSNGEEVKIML